MIAEDGVPRHLQAGAAVRADRGLQESGDLDEAALLVHVRGVGIRLPVQLGTEVLDALEAVARARVGSDGSPGEQSLEPGEFDVLVIVGVISGGDDAVESAPVNGPPDSALIRFTSATAPCVPNASCGRNAGA